MRRWTIWMVGISVGSVLLAGCLGGNEDGLDPDGGPDDGSGNEDGPGGGIGAGEEETVGWNATLEEPPPLQVGQWWQYEVAEGFTGQTFEVTIVVADEEDDAWITGAADGEGLDESVILHIPGIGKLGKDDLSWDVHDEWFTPVRFPLEAGDTWETMWSAQDVEAKVVEVSGLQATVEFTGATNITLVYDAKVQAVVSMQVEGYGGFEVVDSGLDHEGTVMVPYDYDLIVFHGRFLGVLGIGMQNMEPGGPVETIAVEGEYDRASFILFALGITPGAYHVDATVPDGSEYTLTTVATELETIGTSLHAVDDPVGDWEATFVTGGAGVVFVEAFGYQLLEIQLPAEVSVMEQQTAE